MNGNKLLILYSAVLTIACAVIVLAGGFYYFFFFASDSEEAVLTAEAPASEALPRRLRRSPDP